MSMTMFRIAIALALLACAVSGRRVQHSVDQLHVRSHSVADATQSDSAAEATAFNPSAVPRGVRLAGSSKGPPKLQTRISPANPGIDEANGKITSRLREADIKMVEMPKVTEEKLENSAEVHEQRMPTASSASADRVPESATFAQRESWYANLRTNAVILGAATFCARIALMFRNRGKALEADALQSKHSAGGASPRVTTPAMLEGEGAAKRKIPIDLGLLLCVSLWYLGNYYYNITNKLALNAAMPVGGVGAPLTVSTLQLVVGAAYGIFLWLAPDARKRPTITFKDWVATLPVSAASAFGHAATVFAFSAGSVSFGQIVKAAEPACAAFLGLLAYGTVVSRAKWLSLIPVIGGVALASAGEINFAWAAFLAALASNLSGAVRANENKKLMSSPGISERLGSVGNQYAISTINQLIISIPFVILFEGNKLGEFWQLWKVSPVLIWNTIYSGMWYYLYNELSTIVIKKTNAVTQTVLSTAKRVIIIVGVALVLGESLPPIKLIGSLIGVAGVFMYSLSK